MNEDLVVRWNSRVERGDTVYILGDLAMGKLAESLEYVDRLNGTKFLIPGNHDRMFHGNDTKKANASQRYVDAGIHAILAESINLHISPTLDVIATHFPYEGDRSEEDRYADHRLPDRGDYLLHGHTHGLWRRNGRMIDVGVDAWAGYPVLFDDVAGLFMSDDADAKPLEWTHG
jgi:calcineurin-like phosphoesterase family protein